MKKSNKKTTDSIAHGKKANREGESGRDQLPYQSLIQGCWETTRHNDKRARKILFFQPLDFIRVRCVYIAFYFFIVSMLSLNVVHYL